ncbi:MAG: right-handed parallel beta-helix repeat-containing protein [bacterium]
MNRYCSLIILSGVSAAFQSFAAVVEISDFGMKPGDGKDATPAVRAALEQCKASKADTLAFGPGRYDFFPERAVEEYGFVSNNDEGLKRIAFLLAGFDTLQIDGRGATFVFHGFMSPFVLDHSRNITLKNFSMDFARTFHSEGVIKAVGTNSVDLEFSEAFPFDIRNNILVFTDGKKDRGPQTTVKSDETLYPYGGMLEFDPRLRETAYMARDYAAREGVTAERLGPRQARVNIPRFTGTPGNVLVFGAAFRSCPGVTISDSTGVKLECVDIFHCGGMGVIAQRSRDIELRRVRVTPAPGSGRVVSITADATHFANCAGKIVMEDCLFENQKDDATNIHGIYAQVVVQTAPDAIEVRLVHPQQAGFDFIVPGGRLELVHGPSVETYGQAVVKSVRRINKEYTAVVLEAPLPTELKVGDAVASLDWNTAEVLIKGCTIRGNRARGILLGSRGKIVVEDNLFHAPGAAILFEGDARFWFEQAGVRDVVIRHNTFDNCNFGVWSKACIEVGSGIAKECRATSRYNRNIRIEDNLFKVFENSTLLGLYSVDGVVFKGNQLERTNAYPARPGPTAPMFNVVNSDNVQTEPPRF